MWRSVNKFWRRAFGTKMVLYEPKVDTKKATFGLGCFWHSESQYGCAPGVIRTRVGYVGGTLKNPTYRNLGDHTEAVDIDYDYTKTTYEALLDIFWESHNSTLCHKPQYMSAIFYHDDEQKKLAEESKMKRQKSETREIVTKILPVDVFYEAENYHQKYALRNYTEIFDSLDLEGKQLINSHVAAKLNGYLGGSGKKNMFEEEWKMFGISENVAKMILDEMSRGSRLVC